MIYDPQNRSAKTNFGFKRVNITEKKALVYDLFSDIATKYDLMNDLMSFGVHRCWKSEFCSKIPDFLNNFIF